MSIYHRKEDKNDPNYKLRRVADDFIYEVFSDRIYQNVITISRDEMRNFFINVLATFLDFQRKEKL